MRNYLYWRWFFIFLKDLLKEFKFDMECKNMSPRTIKTTFNITRAFFIFLENELKITELEEINHLCIKKYISHMKNLKRTESYCNGIIKNLRMFYRYCVQEEYLTEKQNPILKVKWVKEPKTIIETFTDHEAQRMLKQWDFNNFYNARNKAIISMFFETGIRNLELCNLNVTDVRDRIILIKGKGNKERYVPISPMLKKILIKYDRIRNGYVKNKMLEEDSYFLSWRGKRLTVESVERVVKITGEDAKVGDSIRCSPHTIRHYYAQFMLSKGEMDIYTVSRLLGHQDTTITKRYLESLKDEEIVNMSVNTSPLMLLK